MRGGNHHVSMLQGEGLEEEGLDAFGNIGTTDSFGLSGMLNGLSQSMSPEFG